MTKRRKTDPDGDTGRSSSRGSIPSSTDSAQDTVRFRRSPSDIDDEVDTLTSDSQRGLEKHGTPPSSRSPKSDPLPLATPATSPPRMSPSAPPRMSPSAPPSRPSPSVPPSYRMPAPPPAYRSAPPGPRTGPPPSSEAELKDTSSLDAALDALAGRTVRATPRPPSSAIPPRATPQPPPPAPPPASAPSSAPVRAPVTPAKPTMPTEQPIPVTRTKVSKPATSDEHTVDLSGCDLSGAEMN